jgi:hypothetical protein
MLSIVAIHTALSGIFSSLSVIWLLLVHCSRFLGKELRRVCLQLFGSVLLAFMYVTLFCFEVSYADTP